MIFRMPRVLEWTVDTTESTFQFNIPPELVPGDELNYRLRPNGVLMWSAGRFWFDSGDGPVRIEEPPDFYEFWHPPATEDPTAKEPGQI